MVIIAELTAGISAPAAHFSVGTKSAGVGVSEGDIDIPGVGSALIIAALIGARATPTIKALIVPEEFAALSMKFFANIAALSLITLPGGTVSTGDGMSFDDPVAALVALGGAEIDAAVVGAGFVAVAASGAEVDAAVVATGVGGCSVGVIARTGVSVSVGVAIGIIGIGRSIGIGKRWRSIEMSGVILVLIGLPVIFQFPGGAANRHGEHHQQYYESSRKHLGGLILVVIQTCAVQRIGKEIATFDEVQPVARGIRRVE